MLYWGEGDSKIENAHVKLVNIDVLMLKIFCLFLQLICRVVKEKIKMSMILYPDLNEKCCREYWSRGVDIPENQFWKTQFIQGRHPTKRLSQGICMVNVDSRALKEKIFIWIKLYQRELMRA